MATVDAAWLHGLWAAAVLALMLARPRASGSTAVLLFALTAGLGLRLLWFALVRPEGVGTLALLPSAYLLPAALLALARRRAAVAGAVPIALARTRDLALILGIAAGVAVTNGIALRIGEHALLAAGTGCALWLLAARTLVELRPYLPAGRLVACALLIPATFALAETVRLFFGDAAPVRQALDIGPLPLINALLPGYGVPALLLARLGAMLPHPLPRRISRLFGLAFALAFLHLETRQLFEGAVIAGPMGERERFATLAVWLAFALVCLTIAIRRRSREIAYAAALTATAATLRLLFFDRTALSGLWLAAAVVAWGAVLLSIGVLWHRTGPTGLGTGFAMAPQVPMSRAGSTADRGE